MIGRDRERGVEQAGHRTNVRRKTDAQEQGVGNLYAIARLGESAPELVEQPECAGVLTGLLKDARKPGAIFPGETRRIVAQLVQVACTRYADALQECHRADPALKMVGNPQTALVTPPVSRVRKQG